MERRAGRVGVIAILAIGVAASACSDQPGRFGAPSGAATASTPTVAPADDPAAALTGRAVIGLAGGEDAVLRIGQPAWSLPGESVLDVHEDRVLSGVATGDASARLIVRDLDGNVLRELDAGFNLPQTAIVRGDAVFFAGVQASIGADVLDADDQGIWVALGDEAPRRIHEPADVLRYQELHLSPDGRTLGAWACGATCRAILIPDRGDVQTIEAPGLTALTNEAAVLLNSWSGISGYSLADGAELWRHETEGSNWGRHAMSDGKHIVHTTITEGDDDGRSADGYRIEVIDGTTGVVVVTIDVPTDEVLWSLSPSLSTDRYGVLIPTVLPDPADAPIDLLVVDLRDGSVLDVDLTLAGPDELG